MAAFLFFFLSVFFTCFHIAQAQDTTRLEGVEVSVWNWKLSPFAKHTLTAKDISAAYTAQDLPFLLETLTPSLVAYSDAGTGVGQTSFRIRGTDPSRTLLSVNGMPFNDAESQGIFIGNIPDIASSATDISVQRGVGASTSAGASLGASIQINTLKKADAYHHFSFNAQYGSYATMRHTLSFQSALNKGFNIDVRLSQIHSDGYVERAKANYYALYAALNYQWKKRALHLVYFGGLTRNVQAWLGISKEDLLTNRRINYSGVRTHLPPYNPKDHYDQHNVQLIYRDSLSQRLYFRNIAFAVFGRGFYDSYNEDASVLKFFPNSLDKRKGDMIRENWLRNVLIGDIAQWQLTLNKQHSVQVELGAQAYYGQHLGWVYGGNGNDFPLSKYYHFPAYKYSGSAQAQWRYTILPELSLYTDIQLRTAYHKIMGDREDAQAFINSPFFFANPKIGLTYSKHSHTVFLSYAYSGREPTRDEIVSTLGNIRPEYLQDLEMAYTYMRARFRITHTLYYMFYANQLVLTGAVNDVGGFLRRSVGRSLRMGIEQEINWAIGKQWKAQSNLSVARNVALPEQGFKGGTPLPFSPAIIAGGSLIYNPWRTLILTFRTQYVSAQYMDGRGLQELSLPAYWLQFLTASYTHTFKKATLLTMRARVDNVFNTAYTPNGYVYGDDGYYFPAAGRTYSLQMIMSLRW